MKIKKAKQKKDDYLIIWDQKIKIGPHAIPISNKGVSPEKLLEVFKEMGEQNLFPDLPVER